MREELFIPHCMNDKYVTTHSEGEEPFRRVVVTLKKIIKVKITIM